MEENITQRKTNTVNIVVHGSQNTERYTKLIKEYLNPDGKDVREFIFSDTAPVPVKGAARQDILFFITATEGNDEIKLLKRSLDKKQKTYICINSDDDKPDEKIKEAVAEMEMALDMGFSLRDFAQLRSRGITIESVRQQLAIFRNGISKITLRRPATLNDGIFSLDKELATNYARVFDANKDNFKLMKFVPASGAASRMFKFLCEFTAEFDPESETINAYINRKNENNLSVFFVGIDKFPFFNEVLQATKESLEYAGWRKDLRYLNFVKVMLSGRFDFANKPKGILPFHQYEGFIATPVYEHLKEGVAYAGSNDQAHIHFTISEEHLDGFLDSIKDVKQNIEQESGTTINFSFSNQHKQTDTLAVDLNNLPFRDEHGNLVFRPGGHGALIENLNALDADIVFVKNIDNVSHNNIDTIALYKKALAGKLIELQQMIYSYMGHLEEGNVTEEDIAAIIKFARADLSLPVPENINKFTFEHKVQYMYEALNRPIRICGMVKNEGEPGGGPFWVEEGNGKISLQIVESSQIDLEDKPQSAVFASSTHFNPVDLVCGLKNYKGEKFDLKQYIDSSTGFIVYKNKNGKDVKSYELPGLWNGAMAGWITVFMEVPLDTFNPVKTVNDLLKPAHQP